MDADPVTDLRRIAFLLERANEPTFRVRAFRRAAQVLESLPDGELARRVADGTLTELPGVGPSIARTVIQSSSGQEPDYLRTLTEGAEAAAADGPTGGEELRAALRGDLHTHSDWSDGGSPILEMALAARELGHEYVALTDHSPRLTVARGLSADRLRGQLAVVAEANARLAPFRVLTGIEVDILADGSLDQEEDLLAELDVVVASVHSDLRMPEAAMTARMLAAVANPHTDVLGHCTGRKVAGRNRPESRFDADAVFQACVDAGVAVEVNSRPDRLDPPRRLLRQAIEAGCLLAVDSDGHAPGQLDWLPYGCARAVECEVPFDRVVNTWPVGELLAWTEDHESVR